MTNASLMRAADIIDNAWCKGDLRSEAETEGQGDRYCAVGALAVSLMPEDKMMTLDGEYIGDPDQMSRVNDILQEIYEIEFSTEDFGDKELERVRALRAEIKRLLTEGHAQPTYEMVEESPLTRALALNILRDTERSQTLFITEERRSRVLEALEESQEAFEELGYSTSEIVFGFNDARDIEREDVVALFREVAEEVDTDE